MSEIQKVNIEYFKLGELTLEEQEAFNYFNKSSEEVTFKTNIDGDKFLEALGIKKEENFGELQYKILTLLSLIVKQQKEIENSVSKDVIKNRIKELEDIIDKYIKAKEYNQADLQLCKKRVLQELL